MEGPMESKGFALVQMIRGLNYLTYRWLNIKFCKKGTYVSSDEIPRQFLPWNASKLTPMVVLR